MLLHLDCGAGISGAATLAALAHLGVDYAPLAEALARVGVLCSIEVADAVGPAGPGCSVSICWKNGGQLPCRLSEYTAIIDNIDAPSRVRQRAAAAVHALAEACAYARQTSPAAVDAVELSGGESGAEPNAFIHTLGTAFGLEALGVERLTTSALPWFTGSVVSAHGSIPLPRPATAFLIQGKAIFATTAREELVTPTGAALVHALAAEIVCGPQGVVAGLGTGYGLQSFAGGLRAWLVQEAGRGVDHTRGGNESVVQFESHIDHLNGEDLGMALTALSSMPEVLDVLWLPGVGKKNRPAGLLRVLCLPGHRPAVADAVLRHTHTLGLRVQTLERMVAPRHAAVAEVAGQQLPAKEYVIEGQTYLRPEADALEAAARQRGVGVPALRNVRGKNG